MDLYKRFVFDAKWIQKKTCLGIILMMIIMITRKGVLWWWLRRWCDVNIWWYYVFAEFICISVSYDTFKLAAWCDENYNHYESCSARELCRRKELRACFTNRKIVFGFILAENIFNWGRKKKTCSVNPGGCFTHAYTRAVMHELTFGRKSVVL